jgi:hypothetical protein
MPCFEYATFIGFFLYFFSLRRRDMLRAEADADHSGRYPAEIRIFPQKAQLPWKIGMAGLSQDMLDELILNEDLNALNDPRRQFAALLYSFKIRDTQVVRQESRHENIGGCNSVLNGEIDAYSPDRRHRMGGIADADKARAIPCFKPVDGNREQFEQVPIIKDLDAISHEWNDGHDILLERSQPFFLYILKSPFLYKIAALPVASSLYHNKYLSVIDAAKRPAWVRFFAGKPEPKHIHRSAGVVDREAALFPNGRVPSKGAHDELGPPLRRFSP